MKKLSDPLLQEVFATDALDQLRSRSLEQMLVAARARRQHRRMILAGGTLVILVLALTQFYSPHVPQWPVRKAVVTPPNVPIVASVAVPPKSESVKFISNEELFALFPNRPLALIGSPGEQRLVFLDEPHSP